MNTGPITDSERLAHLQEAVEQHRKETHLEVGRAWRGSSSSGSVLPKDERLYAALEAWR